MPASGTIKNINATQKVPYASWSGISNSASILKDYDNGYNITGRNAANTAAINGLKFATDDTVELNGGTYSPLLKTVEFAFEPALTNQVMFIADRAYEIVAIKEIHAVAGNDAGAVTLNITKDIDGVAPAGGDNLLTAGFNLKGTANTQQTGTLVSSYTTRTLAVGNRLSLSITGTPTAVAGILVQVILTPGCKSETAIYNVKSNTDLADACFYVANRPMIVTGVYCAFSTLGTHAAAVSLQVTKDTSTNAPGAGTDILTNNANAGFNMKSTINTVQTGTLTATAATLRLAPGDRLSVDFAGTLTALAGVVVVVSMSPHYETVEKVFKLAHPGQTITDNYYFIADRPYEIIDVREVHSVAGNDAGAVNLQLTLDAVGTTAPGAGVDLLSNNTNAGFDLKGTANTVQVGTFIAAGNNFMLPGDRLSWDLAGTPTSLAGVVVTVVLRKA